MTLEDRKAAAHLLGMKPSEIAAITGDDDRVIVTTHDGTQSLIDAAGVVTFLGPAGSPVPQAQAETPGSGESADTGGQTKGDSSEPVVGVKRKMAEILAWVEADPDQVTQRAAVALEAENAGPETDRRASLITKLEGLAGL